jgi:uncharacterized phage protein gp47/JayE
MTSPVAATVSATGISAPNFASVYSYLVSQFQAIYGADAYLGNDSQDGQWIGVISQAISDCNSAAVAVYNSFSPTTAQGNGLSSNVKLNGLTRIAGSFSTATLTVVGVAGTVITNGQAQDTNGNLWALPSPTTIPNAGTIAVSATCTTIGAITAGANAINSIATPVLGWQTVNNASAASAGNSVETDAQLRLRQAASVSLPSVGIFAGIAASIAQVTGVTRVTPYENSTNTTNSNGIPANTLAFVVEGGIALSIAQAIASKVPPGIGTYITGAGGSNFTITDSSGYTNVVGFMAAGNGAPGGTSASIGVNIGVHSLNGYATTTGALIASALQSVINNVPIGGVVNVAQLIQAALLQGTSQASTFLVKTLQVNSNGGGFQSTDITLAFNIAAVPGTISVNLV